MSFRDILITAIFGAAFAIAAAYVILEIKTLIDIFKSPVIKFSTFKQSYETKNSALRWSMYSRHPENWSLYSNYVSIDFTYFRFSFKDTLKYRKWRKERLKSEKENKISEILLDIYEQIQLDEKRKISESTVKSNVYEITSDEFCHTKNDYAKEILYAYVDDYSDDIYYTDEYVSYPTKAFPEDIEKLLHNFILEDDSQRVRYIRDDVHKIDYEIDMPMSKAYLRN